MLKDAFKVIFLGVVYLLFGPVILVAYLAMKLIDAIKNGSFKIEKK